MDVPGGITKAAPVSVRIRLVRSDFVDLICRFDDRPTVGGQSCSGMLLHIVVEEVACSVVRCGVVWRATAFVAPIYCHFRTACGLVKCEACEDSVRPPAVSDGLCGNDYCIISLAQRW